MSKQLWENEEMDETIQRTDHSNSRRIQTKKRYHRVFLCSVTASLAVSLCINAFTFIYVNNHYNITDTEQTQSSAMNSRNIQNVSASLLDTSSSSTLSIADVAALVTDSVVEIRTETVTTGQRMGQFITAGAGSGVIVSNDGYIVTNNHVIEGAGKITVALKNGETYNGTLVGTDSQTDIAIIKIDAANLQPAVLGDSDSLRVGETAIAVGNPLGELGGTVTDGIISALDREIELNGTYMNLLQTNAAINPGNSGGGLFDSDGALIGIVVAKSSGTDVEGLGFAIPINDVKDVINSIIDYGYVKGRASAGIEVIGIEDARTAMMYRVNQTGVYINSVIEGSPAQSAGLQAGDRIVAVDSTEISTTSDLTKVLNTYSVGDTITITVDRNGQQIKLSLTLIEASV